MSEKATEKWAPPPRRRVYLMRHGEVDYFDAQGRPFRPEGVPLNADGRRQAEAAGRALAEVPLDRAVTSGLRRSTETAALVVAPRPLPVESLPALREIETGRLSQWGEGPADQVEKLFLGALAGGVDDATRFLAGETFGSLRNRVVPCFQGLLAAPGWRHLVVVAHGVVNRVLLSWMLHGGLAGLGGFEQDAGCINVIDVDGANRCLLRLVNYTPADPVKAGLELTTMEQLYLQYRRGRPRPIRNPEGGA
jgi:probable phosphoglycerate mutase